MVHTVATWTIQKVKILLGIERRKRNLQLRVRKQWTEIQASRKDANQPLRNIS